MPPQLTSPQYHSSAYLLRFSSAHLQIESQLQPTARERSHALRCRKSTCSHIRHSTAPRLQLPGGSRLFRPLLQRKPRGQTWHPESPCKLSDTPSQQHSTHWVQLRQQQMERRVEGRTACPHARPHHNVTARRLDSGSAALPYRGGAC